MAGCYFNQFVQMCGDNLLCFAEAILKNSHGVLVIRSCQCVKPEMALAAGPTNTELRYELNLST